jgi:hypothetical protein
MNITLPSTSHWHTTNDGKRITFKFHDPPSSLSTSPVSLPNTPATPYPRPLRNTPILGIHNGTTDDLERPDGEKEQGYSTGWGFGAGAWGLELGWSL